MKRTDDTKELRDLSEADLVTRFSTMKRDLYDARSRMKGLPTSEVGRLRRGIARLVTVARERGLRIS
ncbi:MAG: 50S ribosomal protein L29 [bacterium]